MLELFEDMDIVKDTGSMMVEDLDAGLGVEMHEIDDSMDLEGPETQDIDDEVFDCDMDQGEQEDQGVGVEDDQVDTVGFCKTMAFSGENMCVQQNNVDIAHDQEILKANKQTENSLFKRNGKTADVTKFKTVSKLTKYFDSQLVAINLVGNNRNIQQKRTWSSRGGGWLSWSGCATSSPRKSLLGRRRSTRRQSTCCEEAGGARYSIKEKSNLVQEQHHGGAEYGITTGVASGAAGGQQEVHASHAGHPEVHQQPRSSSSTKDLYDKDILKVSARAKEGFCREPEEEQLGGLEGVDRGAVHGQGAQDGVQGGAEDDGRLTGKPMSLFKTNDFDIGNRTQCWRPS